jgi:hypothetical protein
MFSLMLAHVKDENLLLSKLFRNVPILNCYENSPPLYAAASRSVTVTE